MPQNLKLKINDKLEVCAGEKVYKSLIVDLSLSEIMINLPVRGDKYLLLDKDDEIECFHSNMGKCYKIKCKVNSRGIENGVGYYKLAMPYLVEKIQRRSNFRVELNNRTLLYKKVSGLGKSGDDQYKSGKLYDLSAGGIKAEIDKPIDIDDVLKLKILLRDKKFELKGIVVRCEDSLNGNKMCGIQFLNITERQCDDIISELFEITRKQRML